MFKTIVWATDGSESADRALPYVKSLARDGAALVVVHAIESFVTGYSKGLPIYGDTDDVRAKIERQVDELRSDGAAVDATVINADTRRPAELIADTAREAEADLIVVGTRGHTAIGGLLVGSVTQRLLHVAPCAVLAVPPAVREDEVATAPAAGATA
jgi:nucleotide-binding universal stress UspA family protein